VTDAAYKRRGWNFDGIPTLERLIELNIDLPELVQIIEPHVRSTAQTATTQPTPNIKS
jgi:aldehyde:ferredoxin oxidoreductase